MIWNLRQLQKSSYLHNLREMGFYERMSFINGLNRERENEAERNSLEKIDLNGHDLTTVKIENPTKENITNHLKNYRYGWWVVSDNSTLYYPDTTKYHVVIADKYNFTKTGNCMFIASSGYGKSVFLSNIIIYKYIIFWTKIRQFNYSTIW